MKVKFGGTGPKAEKPSIGRSPIINPDGFSRIFRVEVVDTKTTNQGVFVGFVHKDHTDINNARTAASLDNDGPIYAKICDGIAIPTKGSHGLVASIYGNKIGGDLFYLQTYFNPQKIDSPVAQDGSFNQTTQNGGIVVSATKAFSSISAGKNKVQITDDNVKIGEEGKGLDVSGKNLIFKNSNGETRMTVGEDGVIISSPSDIKFISKDGNIELIGEKIIHKSTKDLEVPESKRMPNEENSKNFSRYVTGGVEFGASAFNINVTDPSLIKGSPFSGDAFNVKVMRGDSHFKIANGDFLVSLLDGGITDKKFKVVVGKMSFIKKAELSLDSNGFTIASGTTTLKLSRYLLDFNDGGFGPLSYPKWQIGYRGAFQMKIGIMAEAPKFGNSTMDIIAEEIYLGRIFIPGLDGGGIVTTLTDPVVDYITGMMHRGSSSVFAIS